MRVTRRRLIGTTSILLRICVHSVTLTTRGQLKRTAVIAITPGLVLHDSSYLRSDVNCKIISATLVRLMSILPVALPLPIIGSASISSVVIIIAATSSVAITFTIALASMVYWTTASAVSVVVTEATGPSAFTFFSLNQALCICVVWRSSVSVAKWICASVGYLDVIVGALEAPSPAATPFIVISFLMISFGRAVATFNFIITTLSLDFLAPDHSIHFVKLRLVIYIHCVGNLVPGVVHI